MPEQPKTKVILALHAHLPYVRTPEKRFPLPEIWLHQALTECYIPLILCLRSLIEDNTDFNLTISISPTLLSMLSDEYYKLKYEDYLRTLTEILRRKALNSGEGVRHSFENLLNKVQEISNYYIEIKRDIIGEFRVLAQGGRINLITTAATHAVLPLFRFSDDLIKAQIDTGLNVFAKVFGFRPEGFWLPEMGYYSGLDKILTESGIKYTFLDAHCVLLTGTRPSYSTYLPSVTNSGLKIFPRDLPLSGTIWSAAEGYPGDHRYREFHYDYTYSLSSQELKEFGIEKVPFGLKVYKITGNDKPKEYYNQDEALHIVNMHSDDFIKKITERSALIKQYLHKDPVFTLPFDAELFGHWWYEGPEFLKQIIVKISSSKNIELISPADMEDPGIEVIAPAECSWGKEGFFKSWTNPECTWIYPQIARMAAKFNNIDNKKEAASGLIKEIMLASASDWTFLIDNNTSGEYAKTRIREHIDAAKKILSGIETGNIDENFILGREKKYPLFSAD